MGKIRRVMRCYHCGAVLQSRKKAEPGFIEKALLEEEGSENRVLYCHNCYQKMKAINTGMLEMDTDEEILTILDDAVATDAVILWVVDLFSFNGTLNPAVVKKVKKLNVVAIGTKFDLFPRRVSLESMKSFINDRFQEVGIKPVATLVVGNTEKLQVEDLLQKLDDIRKGHDVYMLGSTTSGKTSLINKMLKNYTNKTKRQITREEYPRTSVKVLDIPLTNSSSFYELPGFSLNTSVLGKVEKDVLKIIVPKKEIKVQREILDEGDALVVGSLAGFAMIKGKPTSFYFYGSELCEVRKMKYQKIDAFFQENVLKRSYRPVSEKYSFFTDYDVFEYQMEADNKEHDIAVTGLGWVRFTGRGQVIRIISPRGVAIKETLSKIEK